MDADSWSDRSHDSPADAEADAEERDARPGDEPVDPPVVEDDVEDDEDADPDAAAAVDLIALYRRELQRHPRLTADEEHALAERIAAGDRDAEQRMIEGNLRFVIFVAKRYTHRGLSLLDLIQEGNIGLMKAARLFRTELGVRFATYAAYRIRHAIERALDTTGRLVPLSVHAQQRRRRVARVRQRLQHQRGRAVTDAEVEAEFCALGGTPRRFAGIPPQTTTVSLTAPAGGREDGDPRETRLANPDERLPEDRSAGLGDVRRIHALLALPPREATILRLRFGLDDGTPAALDEVAAAFGLSRQRVKQIEAGALARLRRRLTRGRPAHRAPRAEMSREQREMKGAELMSQHTPGPPRVEVERPAGSNGDRAVVLRTRRGAVVRRFVETED
jgi:RNA polymerase primary sigma factor